MDRRTFLKKAGAAGAGMGLLGQGPFVAAALAAGPKLANGAPNAERIGWRLGCETWTFNRFPLYEVLGKVASVGLHCIETGPDFQIAKGSKATIEANMPAAARNELLKRLSDSAIKLVSYWPRSFDRQQWEFAKELGVENIAGEPEEAEFDKIERLCDEYGLTFSIHNHPNGQSHYWNPDTVLKVCKGRSKRIGACCDTGHWMRSGIRPLEAVKKLKGRIISFHFKDLNKSGDMKAHDVPWGTGQLDARAVLAEIYRQRLKTVFYVEYEYHWDNNLPEVAQCVKFFDKAAAELARRDR
jgi:sugar phosphate isomerase/epimerase